MLCEPKRILSIGEALQTITDVQSRAKSYQSALIAITGIDGCGKGYVAALWRDWLKAKGFHVALIGVDGWLNLPNKRFGGPDPAEHFYLHALRFDEMFTQLVLPLRQDRSVLVEADFVEETASQYLREVYEFQDVDVILLEGIYLLKRKFRHLYDASFWIDCTHDTALERAIARRQEGLTATQTTSAYHSIYFPAQEVHARLDDPKNSATAIVINDHRLVQASRER